MAVDLLRFEWEGRHYNYIPSAVYYDPSSSEPYFGFEALVRAEELANLIVNFKLDLVEEKTYRIKTKNGYVEKTAREVTRDFLRFVFDHLKAQVPHVRFTKPPLLIGKPPFEDETDRRKFVRIMEGVLKEIGVREEISEKIEFWYEPFAIFMFYQRRKSLPESPEEIGGKRILAIDWGGGTFNVAVIYTTESGDVVGDERRIAYRVPRSKIGQKLGGKFLDEKLAEVFLSRVGRRQGLSEEQMERLRRLPGFLRKIEECKIGLVKEKVPQKRVEFSFDGMRIEGSLRMEDLKEAFDSLWERIWDLLKGAMKMASKKSRIETTPKNIDFILLGGGSSNIPFFEEKLKSVMPQARILREEEFEFAVAEGLAYECEQYHLGRGEKRLLGVIPEPIWCIADSDKANPVERMLLREGEDLVEIEEGRRFELSFEEEIPLPAQEWVRAKFFEGPEGEESMENLLNPTRMRFPTKGETSTIKISGRLWPEKLADVLEIRLVDQEGRELDYPIRTHVGLHRLEIGEMALGLDFGTTNTALAIFRR